MLTFAIIAGSLAGLLVAGAYISIKSNQSSSYPPAAPQYSPDSKEYKLKQAYDAEGIQYDDRKIRKDSADIEQLSQELYQLQNDN